MIPKMSIINDNLWNLYKLVGTYCQRFLHLYITGIFQILVNLHRIEITKMDTANDP